MADKTAWAKRLKLYATYLLPIAWAVALLLFLNVTSPLKSGPLSVLIAFILIYLLFVSTLYALVFTISKIAQFLGWRPTLDLKTLYYLVSVLALGPVFILALNTLGQLEIKDIILVLLLLSVGCFYVLRRSRKEVR